MSRDVELPSRGVNSRNSTTSRISLSTDSSEASWDDDDDITKYEQYRYYPGTERDSFDYITERHGLHTTTNTESIAHVIKGTLGAGVLSMHEGFMYGGLWTSLIMTFFVGLLNYYTMYMLSGSAQLMYARIRTSKLSYPDLAEAAAATGAWKKFRKCSKVFRYTVDSSLVLCMTGTCCIYQIIIAKTLKLVLESICGATIKLFAGNPRVYVLMTAPILLAICVIRSLKYLAPLSMMSDILVGVCVMATLYYSLQTGQHISERPAFKNVQDFIKFIGITVYCTCGIAVCLPVENNMKKPYDIRFVCMCAMAVSSILTALTGFFGYWGWGEHCTSPITVHMPTNEFTIILQALLGLMLCVTFSVQFWVPFRIIWHYLRNIKKYKRRSRKSMGNIEIGYRILIAVAVTTVSIVYPNLTKFMSFLGSFFLGFIAFIFPAFIETLITWKDDKRRNIRWRISKNFLLIIFGFALSGTSFFPIKW